MNCEKCGTELQCMPLGGSLADFDCPNCNPDGFKPIEMTRDEWYNSSQFKLLRLFHNKAHQVGHLLQEINDVLEIIVKDKPEMICFDAYNLAERQLRVSRLEANNLVQAISNLENKLERICGKPNKFKGE